VSKPLSLEEQILVALRRITRAIDLRSRTLLQDYGLTAPQLTTLQAIARLETATAGALAKEVHLGHPTVTGILNRLELRGMVERVRSDEDRRTVRVSLTTEGQRVLNDAPSLLQDQFQDELEKLKGWERTQILATLQRIADMMDATTIDAAPVLSSELADVTTAEASLHIEDTESGSTIEEWHTKGDFSERGPDHAGAAQRRNRLKATGNNNPPATAK
jgi:DNA-binding MarR family transcriptional regulator